MRRLVFAPTTLYAALTTKKFIPVTAWMSASEAAKARMVYIITNADANFRCSWAYQTADVESDAPTTFEVTAAAAGDGLKVGAMSDISANTGTKALVRFGFYVWNSSAAVLVFATANGEIEYGRV
jgi:hypothetical protein